MSAAHSCRWEKFRVESNKNNNRATYRFKKETLKVFKLSFLGNSVTYLLFWEFIVKSLNKFLGKKVGTLASEGVTATARERYLNFISGDSCRSSKCLLDSVTVKTLDS